MEEGRMKPANFPERKRQRQQRALDRILLYPTSPKQDAEIAVLRAAVATPLRDKRTKKDRTSRGRFIRAA